MTKSATGNSTIEEIMALKERFEKIKSETEILVTDAKRLSDVGIHEAKELLASAKSNWHALVDGFSSLNLNKVFGGATKKKVKAKVKKAVKSVVKKAKSKKKK